MSQPKVRHLLHEVGGVLDCCVRESCEGGSEGKKSQYQSWTQHPLMYSKYLQLPAQGSLGRLIFLIVAPVQLQTAAAGNKARLLAGQATHLLTLEMSGWNIPVGQATKVKAVIIVKMPEENVI